MNASNRVRIATAVLSVVIAALLMGAVDRNSAKSAATPPPVAQSPAVAPMIGVATGEFQDGVPDLPPAHRDRHRDSQPGAGAVRPGRLAGDEVISDRAADP